MSEVGWVNMEGTNDLLNGEAGEGGPQDKLYMALDKMGSREQAKLDSSFPTWTEPGHE